MELVKGTKKVNSNPEEKASAVPRFRISMPGFSRLKCFMCNADLAKMPGISFDITRYPVGLYSKVVNNLAKVLGMKDSNKRVLELTEEKAREFIAYCGACHGQVWQLYRLSNAENSEDNPIREEHIEFLKRTLKFKFVYGKRNNSKLKPLLASHSNRSKFPVFGYWYLREAELECVKQMYNPTELSAILADIDIKKISSKEADRKDSTYFLVSCDLEPSFSKIMKPQRRQYSLTRFTRPDDDDDDDDEGNIDMMVDSGQIAPIELVQVNMGNEFATSSTFAWGENDFNFTNDSQHFPIPVGEIKAPRKQILASRVGVSLKKSPIIIKSSVNQNSSDANSRSHSDRSNESDDGDMELTEYPAMEIDTPLCTTKSDTEEGSHICPLCRKIFPNRSAMYGHLYVHRKPYCLYCRQYFHDAKAFNAHNALQHNGKNPEVCHVCQMKFIHPYKLLRHLRQHKNVNTYSCSSANCTETFRVKAQCIAHLRVCPFSPQSDQDDFNPESPPSYEIGSEESGDGVWSDSSDQQFPFLEDANAGVVTTNKTNVSENQLEENEEEEGFELEEVEMELIDAED